MSIEETLKKGRERQSEMQKHLDSIRKYVGPGPADMEGITEDVVLFFTNRTNRIAGLYSIPAGMLEGIEKAEPFTIEDINLQVRVDDIVSAIFDDYLGSAVRGEIEGITCVVIGGVKMDYLVLEDSVILKPHSYATPIAQRLRQRLGNDFVRKSAEEKHEIAVGSPFTSYDVHVNEKGKLFVEPKEIKKSEIAGKRIYESVEEFLQQGDDCD